MQTFLIRAQVFHTPNDPFIDRNALEAIGDGAVAVVEGRVSDVGEYEALRRRFPEAEVVDRRGSLLLPGFVDAHVHYPQLPVIGAMGLRLLEWLEQRTLPEEARFLDVEYARKRAAAFLQALVRNGTTTALVFGAHFPGAMEVFFEEAERSKLRISSGLVLGDRELRPEMHIDPASAYRESLELAGRWHGKGRLRYAVTPRFSLSCSDPLLEVCGVLAREIEGALVTSHLNETTAEIAVVSDFFPESANYLDTYARHGLVSERSVYAHNVHPSDAELEILGSSRAAVCHCPSSNMFLGSGLFPLRRHLQHNVALALGSDVGAGTGLSILKEGLAAYQAQMLHEHGFPLEPAHLLFLATAAGARALGNADIGWFAPGMAFDAVVLSAPETSTLAEVWRHSPSAEATLASAFTLAREESVAEVYVAGERLVQAEFAGAMTDTS